MCIGVPIIGAVLSIAQAAVGFAAASQQANEQNAYFEQNRLNAIAAMRDRYTAVNNKLLEERTAASQDLLEKRVEATKKKATATVAAGEAGVTGLSVDALLSDYDAAQARREASVITNYNIRRGQAEDELDVTYHNTISRINSVRQASKPSPLGFILQGLGGALKGAA
jgi:hypothetical protein